MLYTRKGDTGTTKTFACDQRVSKSSTIAEALGTLDELNSFLGTCKVKAGFSRLDIESNFTSLSDLIHWVQENLFIVQAQVAGADKIMEESKIKTMEDIVDKIEKILPPIKTFFIAGGDEQSATFDFARTLARRAERRVVGVHDEGTVVKLAPETLSFLNRLSSLLYALARLSNHKSGIKEIAPHY
jgi:cob(I)alamin adenosyltransferase